MAKPRQVQQQLDMIDEYYGNQSSQPQAEELSQEQAEQGEQLQAEQGEQAQAQEPSQEQESTGQQQEQEQEQEQKQESSEPSSLQQQVKELSDKLERAEQRHRTLSGMMRSKEEEVQRLETLLGQLSAPQQESQGQQESQAQPGQPSAHDPGEAQDRETYGDDFIDMINRTVRRALQPLEQRLGNIDQMARQSHQTAVETKEERFEKTLDQRVPDWREIDQSQEFLDWLQESPTRLGLVRDGMANYDANGIADVFQQFKMLTGKGQQKEESTPPPSASAAPASSQRLDQKVAPSKGRTSKPTEGTQQKQQWTRSEIAQVFRNRRGYPKAEFDRLQQEIFAAQKEGRVDYSR